MGMVAVVPVRESLRVKVKSQERLRAKEKYKKYKGLYKRNRYKIEQFGAMGVILILLRFW